MVAANPLSPVFFDAPAMPSPRRRFLADPPDTESVPPEIWCCRKSDTNTCKCSLIVACAIDTKQLCWHRRNHGTCDCSRRELPVCLLTTPYGCPVWREGHQCSCPRQEMPCCFVTGCPERREGRRCSCARRPVETCPHVRAMLKRYATLTIQEAMLLGDLWAEHLWAKNNKEYADRELGNGMKTETATEAVELMKLREGLGVSLWHPDDDRGEDSIRRLKRTASGLKRLVGIVRKGGAA